MKLRIVALAANVLPSLAAIYDLYAMHAAGKFPSATNVFTSNDPNAPSFLYFSGCDSTRGGAVCPDEADKLDIHLAPHDLALTSGVMSQIDICVTFRGLQWACQDYDACTCTSTGLSSGCTYTVLHEPFDRCDKRLTYQGFPGLGPGNMDSVWVSFYEGDTLWDQVMLGRRTANNNTIDDAGGTDVCKTLSGLRTDVDLLPEAETSN